MKTANPDIPNIPNTPDVAVQLSSAPAQPLVLFPVRLETRFFQMTDGGSELRVRVYPDKVHIDTHEPALIAEEVTWGQHFWEQTWRAAGDEERAKAAWRQLADRFDPPRAAWITLALKPLNPDDRPQNPIAADAPLTKPIKFPTPATQAEPWLRAPLTRLLPNFWVLLGYKNGQLILNVKGGAIREPLASGPDPSPNAVVDAMGIDAGMRWMVDFQEAEAAGMGIRAKLKKEIAAAGFDFLLVLGVKDSGGVATDWTSRLADVFNAHHYTDGVSFVPPGTPSNNTADAPSGFSSEDPGHEASYRAERGDPVTQSGNRSNADVLLSALGLTRTPEVFANVAHAAETDQLDAQNMNTALWQATWGYFLLQMLGVGQPGESPLTDDDIAWARNHFIQYVRATGPLPAMRVGKQPYGFLPITSLNAWKPPAGQESHFNRDVALRDFLLRLRDVWRRNLPDIPRLGRSDDTPQQSGIDKDLADVMSMDGLSARFSMRNLLGRHYLEHLWTFLSADFFVDVWNLPEIEAPAEAEPPEIEPPDPDMTPAQRAQFRKQQLARRDAFIKAQKARQLAFQRAVAARRALLTGKRNVVTAWWETQERLTTAVLQTLGQSWRPRLAHGTYSGPVATLDGPLVQTDHSPVLSPNYIEALLAARDITKEIRFRNLSVEQPPPHTLLHLLLRHSMLLEYTNAATRLLLKRASIPPESRREPELVDLPVGLFTRTVWRQMAMRINVEGQTEPVELSKYLLGLIPSGEPDVAHEPELMQPLSDFRASLTHLKSLSVPKLEQLLTGTLDLCSHRLDAWITSFASKRLADIRQTNPTGILYGGYGWVMNLTPEQSPPQITPPPGEQAPVFQPANNPGFVHAPSLTQASTVAILRSGHLAHAGADKQKPNDLMAIDLSSERVRLATWLLDGVRQGQPLGALLGYRFERRLQEAGAPEFIATFRELAPLVARKLDQPGPGVAVEAVAANNVVDGLVLLRRWQKGKSTQPPQWTNDTIPFGAAVGQQKTKLPPFDNNNAKFKTVQAELNLLEQTVDAVSDALMAESVFQIVRGNPLRAANTIESIAGGETPPPELEVVRTPRSGLAITHRLISLFNGAPVSPAGWDAPAHSFRANAEPYLNAWAAKLLGSPANVRCLVERVASDTGTVLQTEEVRLSELALTPLDFIYAIEGSAGQQAEIEQRILYRVARALGSVTPGSLLRVNPGRKPEWKTDELSHGEFSELLRATRKLFSNLRAIDDEDLNPPERSTSFSVDIKNLEDRSAAAQASLDATEKAFGDQLTATSGPNLDALRELILQAAAFGVAGAVPLSAVAATPADRELLLVQAGSIRKELAKRLAQLDDLAKNDAASDEEKRDRALAQLRIVFGKAFTVLPRFRATNATELQQAFANSASLQDGDPLAATTWFERMARVRDGVSRLNAALSRAEALNSGERLQLTIAQLPFAANDRWQALPFKPNQIPTVGKLSLAVQSDSPVDVAQPLAGVLIDEWVEVIPSTTEVTGVALQYDQPSTAPPQTILIAVPPEIGAPWTIWSLQQVLLETLDLARIRAADSEALDEVGHYLPALYFACNTLGDTVSTDFTTIK